MKRYERESFLKSFLIFLILLEVLLAINFWNEYQIKKVEIEDKIHIEMKLCAFSLQCAGLTTDFVDKDENKEENILYQDGGFYSYFKVPTSEKYLMKVMYSQENYLQRVGKLANKLYGKFLFYSVFAAFVSLLFSFYALMPLQRALRINEEFVKDILHDFNTPLSSMLINLKLFKREIGDNQKIQRLENNIQSILSLQDNLRIFLKGVPAQSERFSLKELVQDRVHYFEVLYPDVNYKIAIDKTTLETNKDAFTRILDNLLSNAGKYNSVNGDVDIVLLGSSLTIQDTGKGIKHPSRVFDRYYKEQDRGIGIGLHIVKKLCDELTIPIKIQSKKNKGTKIELNLYNVIFVK
ncbi:HAMP domain-containing sensor histidine kinase [Sulfurovum sp. XTW-4]|uniref:histidine kinase n=1 Tax=Sulfurovum xiamenensis TaxID=3019066 RepID=A0ABT7QPX2_9BACT|nr:HAMP domain-containing sensor histidine kinase [Sulfurovum xiamenensis]MDM5263155.1 HAMP domain-containing sensor histidine kinase [Sulfurovum xiamenensis]